ncbi:hypothetical protein Hanom_Chr01g00063021 [Helianthus anomalus]
MNKKVKNLTFGATVVAALTTNPRVDLSVKLLKGIDTTTDEALDVEDLKPSNDGRKHVDVN